jgi:NAD(P)-dependent dehydrogenase (short-subunit alcohol dehydrogenase family)
LPSGATALIYPYMSNASKSGDTRSQRPPQTQSPPGDESKMHPRPKFERREYRGSGKLAGKVALITGADSGIGRATAVLFAREGADVVVNYLSEDKDAAETARAVEAEGRACLLVRGDVGDRKFCEHLVARAVDKFGGLDILVNNAAEQHPQKSLEDIDEDQLVRTFRTNIFAMFFLTRAALPRLRERRGATIINTTSVTAYRGSAELLDYSATKGAIVAFTRSLSQSLAGDKIRVNAVAPGPIWTPLIPSTFPPEKVETFGSTVPLGRAGEPEEVATCFVFLASDDSSYITGQVIHPNGGEIVNT